MLEVLKGHAMNGYKLEMDMYELFQYSEDCLLLGRTRKSLFWRSGKIEEFLKVVAKLALARKYIASREISHGRY